MLRPFSLLAALLALAAAQPAAAQWPTSQFHIESEDGEPLEGERAVGAQVYQNHLVDSARWFQRLGYRAPDLIRVEGADPGRPYLAYLRTDAEDDGSYYISERDTDLAAVLRFFDVFQVGRRFYLSGNPIAWTGDGPVRVYMAGAPTHELFHAIQRAYRTPREDWLIESGATAIHVRWLERIRRTRYDSPFGTDRIMAFTRYYDSPLHQPQIDEGEDGAWTATTAWSREYGTWWFWYAVGELLAPNDPDGAARYMRYVLEASADGGGSALGATEMGLRNAAHALDSPDNVDDGLFEVYPAFVAEHLDDWRFFQFRERGVLDLSGVVQFEGVVGPLTTLAYEIDVELHPGVTEPQRVRLTIEPTEYVSQLHLIADGRIAQHPTLPQDPLTLDVMVHRDTTLLVRVANVAPDAPATGDARFTLRAQTEVFFGDVGSSGDGREVGDLNIPPGFDVVGGPPGLADCRGTQDGGSAFDLMTAGEQGRDQVRMVDDVFGVAEEAMGRMGESMGGQEVEAMRAQMEAARAEAEADARARAPVVEAESAGRSLLVAHLAGQTTAGRPCLIIVEATLNGDGGAQTLTTAVEPPRGEANPVEFEAHYLIGTFDGITRGRDPVPAFDFCMMTEEERREQAASRCPKVCDVGRLELEAASQTSLKGQLYIDVVTSTDAPGGGCPVVERTPLTARFNLVTADAGEDAEVFRGLSDQFLEQTGFSREEIEAFRNVN